MVLMTIRWNKGGFLQRKSNKYISFHGGLSRYIDLSILILVSVKVSVDTYPDSFPETLENIYLQKSIRVHEINRVRKKNVGPDEIEGKTYYQIGSRPGMNYDWNIRGWKRRKKESKIFGKIKTTE